MIKQTKLAQVLEVLEENPHLIEIVQVWAQAVYPHLATPPAQPAQRKPLTDEEIRSIWNDGDCYEEIAFARAIESAHDIKEKT